MWKIISRLMTQLRWSHCKHYMHFWKGRWHHGHFSSNKSAIVFIHSVYFTLGILNTESIWSELNVKNAACLCAVFCGVKRFWCFPKSCFCTASTYLKRSSSKINKTSELSCNICLGSKSFKYMYISDISSKIYVLRYIQWHETS